MELNPGSKYLGLAAEYRVMSELLLRGYNPAKLQGGPDFILEDGTKVEVKCTHRNRNTSPVRYSFTFNRRKGFDVAIVWCFDDNIFYIVPASAIYGDTISIPNRLFDRYKNAWDVLKIWHRYLR